MSLALIEAAPMSSSCTVRSEQTAVTGVLSSTVK